MDFIILPEQYPPTTSAIPKTVMQYSEYSSLEESEILVNSFSLIDYVISTIRNPQ